MSGHRQLTDAELAVDIKLAVRSGGSAREYCRAKGWAYHAVYKRLTRAGLWNDVMAAKYMSQEFPA